MNTAHQQTLILVLAITYRQKLAPSALRANGRLRREEKTNVQAVGVERNVPSVALTRTFTVQSAMYSCVLITLRKGRLAGAITTALINILVNKFHTYFNHCLDEYSTG